MMFATSPDAAVREAMDLHFGIITGLREPTVKPKPPTAKPEKAIPFSEFSFINVMAFRSAFTEAVSRGLCSPAEIVAGNEVMALTS
jgi:hypothetical protein